MYGGKDCEIEFCELSIEDAMKIINFSKKK